MLLESQRRCGLEILQGVFWIQPGALQLKLSVYQLVSGVILKTVAEELS